MKIFISLFLLLQTLLLIGQPETTYYFGVNGNVELTSKAEIKMVFDYQSQEKFKCCYLQF